MLSIYSYKDGVRASLPEIKTKWNSIRFNTKISDSFLEIKHKVSFSFANFLFDKNAGLITFYGYDFSNKERFIFNYNFIKDKINKLHKIKQKFFMIDYESNSIKLLLSPESIIIVVIQNLNLLQL